MFASYRLNVVNEIEKLEIISSSSSGGGLRELVKCISTHNW